MKVNSSIPRLLTALIAIFIVFTGSVLLAQNRNVSNVGYGDQPDIALDSQGNVHIAFSRFPYFSTFYQTFGANPNRFTIIQWNTFHAKNGNPVKFQLILHESGIIDINIKENTGAVDEYPIMGVNHDGEYGHYIGADYPPAFIPMSQTSYRFTWNGRDNYNWGGIEYYWIDAKLGWPVWAEWDDSFAEIPIGFDFTFYGTQYNKAYVSSNGYISFVDNTTAHYANPMIFPSVNPEAADVIAALWDDWNPEFSTYRTSEIYYAMIDGTNGSTLIAPTLVSDWDGKWSDRPTIAVDSEDNVHIVWHDEGWDGGETAELVYTKLDPSLDDQSGNGAVAVIMTEVDDTRLTNMGEWCVTPRLAVDGNDNVNIVWEIPYEGVFYMQISNDNAFINIEPVCLKYISGAWKTSVDLAVDSENNLHITWNDDENTMSYETYYMMIDGGNGSALIEATGITPNDNQASTGQSIAVDGNDKVHITWMDKRGSTVREVWYAKIDPDQANSPDLDGFIVIPDTLIGGAGTWVEQVDCATGDGEHIHVSWWSGFDNNLYYSVLNSNGDPVILEEALTNNGTVDSIFDWTTPVIAVNSSNDAHVTWFDWTGRGVAHVAYHETLYKSKPQTDESNKTVSQRMSLSQNYPNPFNPKTIIPFSLIEASRVHVAIYDIQGRIVSTLVNEMKSAGTYHVVWNGRHDSGTDAAGGVYICKMIAGTYAQTRKIMLIK